jgi:hypothetical protein
MNGYHYLIGGLEHYRFFHILGITHLTHIFQRARYTTNQLLDQDFDVILFKEGILTGKRILVNLGSRLRGWYQHFYPDNWLFCQNLGIDPNFDTRMIGWFFRCLATARLLQLAKLAVFRSGFFVNLLVSGWFPFILSCMTRGWPCPPFSWWN